jgi:hypothetical protein
MPMTPTARPMIVTALATRLPAFPAARLSAGTAAFRATFRAALWAALLSTLVAAGALAAPQAEPWPRWTVHDPDARASIDHSAWGQFLSRYLVESPDGINRVRYAEVTPADRQALAAYIDALAATPIGAYARDEQFAFWANLYNAVTVRTVLDHYPVDSIRAIDISPGLFTRGPWGRKLVTVEGVPLSLDDIEHRILRPIWRDPRIHYMVNCAALGCPNLAPAPFTAGRTEAMLEDAARAFVNHPRGARVEDGRLHVSSIYHWYREDFGDDDAGVIDHLRRYADDALRRALGSVGRIHRHDYDWALNLARPDAR